MSMLEGESDIGARQPGVRDTFTPADSHHMTNFAEPLAGFLLVVALPILIFTGIAVASEARWGRRGLLVSSLICVALVALQLFNGNMGIEITNPIGLDGSTDLHRMFTIAAITSSACAALAFASSALAVRALGASSRRPRSVTVRVIAGVMSGIGGAIIATVLSSVASAR